MGSQRGKSFNPGTLISAPKVSHQPLILQPAGCLITQLKHRFIAGWFKGLCKKRVGCQGLSLWSWPGGSNARIKYLSLLKVSA